MRRLAHERSIAFDSATRHRRGGPYRRLPQAQRSKWLATRDGLYQHVAHALDEDGLVLAVADALGRERFRALQMQVAAKQFGMLARTLLCLDLRVGEHFCRGGARSQELLLFDDPAIALPIDRLRTDDLTSLVPGWGPDRHWVAPYGAQCDLVADLRTTKSLLKCPLEIHAPHRALASLGLDLHEIGLRLSWIVAVVGRSML